MEDTATDNTVTSQQAAQVTVEVAINENVPMPIAVKPSVAKRAAAKVEIEAARERRWALENVASYAKYIAKESEKAAKAQAKAEESGKLWAEAFSLLEGAGFRPEEANYPTWGIRVMTKESKLAKLATVIGRLDPDQADKEIADEKKNTIYVTMPSVRYPMVKVTWIHKLTENDRCKIEVVVVPEETKTQLTCDRS